MEKDSLEDSSALQSHDFPLPIFDGDGKLTAKRFTEIYLQTSRRAAIYFNVFISALLLTVAPIRHFAFGLPFFPSGISALLEWGLMIPLSLAMTFLRWSDLPTGLVQRSTAALVALTSSALVIDIVIWRQSGIPIPRDYGGLFFLGLVSISALSTEATAVLSALFLTLCLLSYIYLEPWKPTSGFQIYFDLVAICFALLNTHTLRREALRSWALQLRLNELAFKDSLTGLANRRYLAAFAVSAFSQARRDQKPIGLGLVDVDRFKSLNDTHGHDAGDEALKCVAGILQKFAARPMDCISRIGGDEFTVLWYGVDREQLEALCAKVHQSIAALGIPISDDASDILSISIGIAHGIPDATKQFDEYRRDADGALYQIKRQKLAARLGRQTSDAQRARDRQDAI